MGNHPANGTAFRQKSRHCARKNETGRERRFMKTIMLLIPQGKTRDLIYSQLSAVYRLICCDRLPADWTSSPSDCQDIKAALVDMEHARDQGLTLLEQTKDPAPFSALPILGLTSGDPRDEDIACVERGFFDLISLPCPRELLLKRVGNAIQTADSIAFDDMERMFKQLPSNIFLKDAEGRYVFAAQYWHHLYHADDPNWSIRGKTDMEIRKDKENAKKAMESDLEILRTGKGTSYIIQEKGDGVSEYLELIKRPVYDKNGRINGIIALINNVTDQQLLRQDLEKRTQLDPLTELLNKRSTENHIRMLLEPAEKDWAYGALLMIDVDDFKHTNDTMGHAAGDSVLAEIARVIRTSFRFLDVTGRVGGDEFMVFLRDIPNAEAARHSAERFQKRIAEAFKSSEAKATLSIGIAMYPQHGVTFDALYQAADQALYKAKNHRKGTCRLYSEE